MRQLLLLRHAKSEGDNPSSTDHARTINEHGRRAVGVMRGVIGGLELAPELLLVSSARRTRQTAEALAPWRRPPQVHVLDALYLAGADALLDVLGGVEERVRSVMVVAHNPGLHELAWRLGRDERVASGYPTAALAEFEFTGGWHVLGGGGARLVRFVCPNDLPEMAC